MGRTGETGDPLDLYRAMHLIRRFEEKAGQLYGTGLIGGFCHLAIGQEATIVGAISVREDGDPVIASHRHHGHMLAAGVPPDGIMAELAGRACGCSAGRGGSMHMADPARGFFGGHGITGSQVPIGAGLAFASRYRSEKAVTLCFYGDAAAQQGQTAETYALAALWRLPIVFVIENNAEPPRPALRDRARPFGIEGEVVDGQDVLAVRAATARAIARCRAGAGPALVEAETERFRGHAVAHRERGRALRARDPVALFRERLAGEGHAKALERIEDANRVLVDRAADHALRAAEPDPATLMDHVLGAARPEP